MEKLVITVTIAPSWMYPDAKNAPQTIEQVVKDVYEAYEEGASIAHIHGTKMWSIDFFREVIKQIREKCDIIVQIGLSAEPIDKRVPLFELRPEMISIILNHHDEYFPKAKISLLHTQDELEEYMALCEKFNVKPEFEVWHAGSIWNLNYLAQRSLVNKPYFLTLFFNWPGGIWSPATPEELLRRLTLTPPESVRSVSVMGPEQTKLLTFAITIGQHVRVGTEDYPFVRKLVPAEGNRELVRKIAEITRGLEREIATPREARKTIGLHQ